MTSTTNRCDAPPGTPFYTAVCQGVGRTFGCGASYGYAREHDSIGADAPSMAAAMTAHINGHTAWTAVMRSDRSGINVWCPDHRFDPPAVAAELRAVADDVAATLAPTDPLDRVLPGTPTHATLLAARASALAGLATLHATERAARRDRAALMTMHTHPRDPARYL